jgi:mono/diheme cytochrome c family protein
MKNKRELMVLAAALLAATAFAKSDTPVGESATIPSVRAASPVDAGRYLVTVGGCNDCHTVNWAESNGAVPEREWLLGSPMGWRGPWGTTYAPNLRLTASNMSEDAWVEMLRHRVDRPPMPWMSVNRLSDSDARAIYQFISWLGPAGETMPAAVGPDEEPTTPYFNFQPVIPQ